MIDNALCALHDQLKETESFVL